MKGRKKEFNWTHYKGLRKVESAEAFRPLKRAVVAAASMRRPLEGLRAEDILRKSLDDGHPPTKQHSTGQRKPAI
jgi:hypothetical protein